MPKKRTVPVRKRVVTLHFMDGEYQRVECWRFWDTRDDHRLGMQLDANQDGPHHWMYVAENKLRCWSVEDAQ